MRLKRADDASVVVGSANVFADIGVPQPEETLLGGNTLGFSSARLIEVLGVLANLNCRCVRRGFPSFAKPPEKFVSADGGCDADAGS